MKVIAIRQGGRARELKASVSDRCMGELFISSATGDGTYRPLQLGGDGSLFFCQAVSLHDRDNSLSEEFPYAFDNNEDIVLMDSLNGLERALGKLGVKPATLVRPLFELLGGMDDVFVRYHVQGWIETALV